jgi:hypothetical protein
MPILSIAPLISDERASNGILAEEIPLYSSEMLPDNGNVPGVERVTEPVHPGTLRSMLRVGAGPTMVINVIDHA